MTNKYVPPGYVLFHVQVGWIWELVLIIPDVPNVPNMRVCYIHDYGSCFSSACFSLRLGNPCYLSPVLQILTVSHICLLVLITVY